MDFRFLLTKWKESLEIFSLKNFSLFLLASINTFVKSLLILVRECWWLILFLLFFLRSDAFWVVNRSFYEPSILRRLFAIDGFVSIGFVIASLFLSFFSFLIVRPSLESKDLVYFIQYSNRFLGFALIALFVGGIPILPVFWMTALFFMDSENNIKSLINSLLNAVKFVVYFFPACFILGFVKIILDYLVVYLMKIVERGIISFIGKENILFVFWDKLFYFVLFFVWLFFLCVMSIYYIRVKHKNFKLFFGE